MARRLVLMPVAPKVTVSEAVNLLERGWAARVDKRVLELSQATPAVVAERMRNSRRRMRPPLIRGYTKIPERCSILIFPHKGTGQRRNSHSRHPKGKRDCRPKTDRMLPGDFHAAASELVIERARGMDYSQRSTGNFGQRAVRRADCCAGNWLRECHHRAAVENPDLPSNACHSGPVLARDQCPDAVVCLGPGPRISRERVLGRIRGRNSVEPGQYDAAMAGTSGA